MAESSINSVFAKSGEVSQVKDSALFSIDSIDTIELIKSKIDELHKKHINKVEIAKNVGVSKGTIYALYTQRSATLETRLKFLKYFGIPVLVSA